jgi:hypothetical protein
MMDTLDWLPGQIARNSGLMPAGFTGSVRNWYSSFFPPVCDHTAMKFTSFRNFVWLRYVFPDDPILVTLRHLIDNYISFKNWELKHGVIPPTPRTWFTDRMPYAAQSLSMVGNAMVIYFEDLVMYPQRTMDRCFDFIGLSSHQLDLSGNHAIHSRMTGLSVLPGDPGTLVHAVTQRRFDDSLIDKDEMAELVECVRESGLLNGLLSPYASDFTT